MPSLLLIRKDSDETLAVILNPCNWLVAFLTCFSSFMFLSMDPYLCLSFQLWQISFCLFLYNWIVFNSGRCLVNVVDKCLHQTWRRYLGCLPSFLLIPPFDSLLFFLWQLFFKQFFFFLVGERLFLKFELKSSCNSLKFFVRITNWFAQIQYI